MAKNFVIVIVMLAIIAGLLFGAWYFTGGGWFGSIPSTFKIAVNGAEYGKDFTIHTLSSGTEFQVNRLFGEEYEVEITAAKDTGAELTVGEETIAWEEAETDFSKGFTIERSEDKFTVTYESLEDVIAKATGYEDFELKATTETKLFLMTVKCAHAEIGIKFGVGAAVTDIEFDRDQIIFGTEYKNEGGKAE